MKNAIAFFAFNLFLLILYIYSQNLTFTQVKSQGLPEQEDGALLFNHWLLFDKGYIEIAGKRFQRLDNVINITLPEGKYVSNESEILFSAGMGMLYQEDKFILKDVAKVNFDNSHIISEEIIYNIKDRKIISEPKTILNFNNMVIEGSNFEYHVDKKLLKADKVKGSI